MLGAFRNLTTFGLTAIFFVLALGMSTAAQGVNDFVITDFQATYSLTNDDPQGLLTITEKISLTFSDQNQGILRAIPQTYKDKDLNIKIISVEKSTEVNSTEILEYQQEPYITYEENDNTVVRIGQAGTYITGAHEYILNYQLENVVSFYDDYDEFYWDVNGDQWLQPFENVSVGLRSNATRYAPLNSECFTGAFGSTDKNCELIEQTNGLDARTTARLDPGETLTIVQTYQKGYFSPPGWFEQNRAYLSAAPILLLQVLVIASAHNKWKKYGKDPKKRGIVAPYFERPKSVSVMQASYVAEKKLAPRHMTAGIIDLAIRGHLKITERTSGKKVVHDITLLKLPDSTVQAGEKDLLNGLFPVMNVGAVIELEKKKNALHTTLSKVSSTVDALVLSKGFFSLSPKNAVKKVGREILLAVALLVVGFIFASTTDGISTVLGIVTLVAVILYGSVMTRRTEEGNLLVEHMEGLKLYLSKAEKERMKMQDAVAAPLAKNTGQPERTVEFFEKLLPFAIAMGVEKSWANAFKDIYTTPPEWYGGNWNTFTTAALISSLNTTAKVTNQTFTSPSSSGSSGSGGGGFSGGGGGGGGGGGW